MDAQQLPAADEPAEEGDGPRHGATVVFIVERLRDAIVSGRLKLGARLVEGELTAQFGVSRGPVREALRRLAADGLIELVPHRGAIVRRLTRREIAELFQIRLELEALAARLAAENGDAARRRQFAEAIAPIFESKPRCIAEYLWENATFHEAVYALADNEQLKVLAGRLQLPLIMAQVGNILTPEILDLSVTEHRAIAAAILDSDPAGARAAMCAHLQRAADVADAQRRADVR
ncbi:MAG: GntR family transcriptional regulator [Ancalomicrobiaceae bacterium]|nr:GntR family transcriptional regulator [Ancalomicrobiaceae bacterium]